jgi:hypothetical protein
MVYKIRVILDAKESIFRDIGIKDKQTLWNLHLGIKSAFSLPGDELSSFYFSDDDWSELQAVPLEDMSDDGDGSKMRFTYGFMDLWEFFCELLEEEPEKPAVNYPITLFRFGKVPLKAPIKKGEVSSKVSKSSMDMNFDDLDDVDFKEDTDDFDEDDDFDDGYKDNFEEHD